MADVGQIDRLVNVHWIRGICQFLQKVVRLMNFVSKTYKNNGLVLARNHNQDVFLV